MMRYSYKEMEPEKVNSDNDVLKEMYADIYGNGGFHYGEDNWLEFVRDSGFEPGRGKSLLDVGCGDGFWSHRLSERLHYRVTGMDISEEGIFKAKELNEGIEFICDDFLSWESYRSFYVVFMRSPSFLNFDTFSDRFTIGIEKALKHCRHTLWFIKSIIPPFDRYEGNSYVHDPEKVKVVFSRYGKCKIMNNGKYFFAQLIKHNNDGM